MGLSGEKKMSWLKKGLEEEHHWERKAKYLATIKHHTRKLRLFKIELKTEKIIALTSNWSYVNNGKGFILNSSVKKTSQIAEKDCQKDKVTLNRLYTLFSWGVFVDFE